MDSGAASDWGGSTSERVYRTLMRAYPEEVRRRYADEMVGYFGDLCREERLSRGTKGVALLWARTLPELLFTALQERGTLFQRNAYLPAGPRTVARWGALCALIGGLSGVAFHLIEYSLFGAIGAVTGSPYVSGPFVRFFTLSLLLCALSLSSLGLFGLYGAVVARSGRPGLLAGAGAISSAAAASLWLSISGYSIVRELASGSTFFAPFEWVFNVGSLVIRPAFLLWFLGFLLLGVAAVLQPLPRRLRVLPLALFALILPSYLVGGYLETVGWSPVVSAIVMGLGQGLPFVGVAVLGWFLIKDHDSDLPVVSSGPVEDAETARGARPGGQTAGGARVTLNSVYAEERYVVVGYEVEDLTDGRHAGEHPAELQPLIGFEGDEKRLQKQGLGTDIVELTDESGAEFRMVNNSGAVSEGPNNMAKGPLQNMAAFEPEESLEPGDEHRFRLKVPLVESPVVAPEEKMPPPEPFGAGTFVFEFEIPVRAVSVVEVGQKDAAGGVTLTLDRVINSPGRPQAVVCFEAPDREHAWFLWGGKGTYEGGWGSSGSMRGVTSSGCQNLELNGPLEGRSSLEVTTIEGMPDCPEEDARAAQACFERIGERYIRGPWRFEFDVPDS